MTTTQDLVHLRALIESAADDGDWLKRTDYRDAVAATVDALDLGDLRLAEKVDGEWIVHSWIQQAILLYFRLTDMQTMVSGPFEYYDRIPLKQTCRSGASGSSPEGWPATGRTSSPVSC